MVEVTRVPSGTGSSCLRLPGPLPSPRLPPGLVNAKVSNERAARGGMSPLGPQVTQTSRRADRLLGEEATRTSRPAARGSRRRLRGDLPGLGRLCPHCRSRNRSFLLAPSSTGSTVPLASVLGPAPSTSTSPLVYVTGMLSGSPPFRAVRGWSRRIRWFPKLNNLSAVSHTA